MNIRLFTEDQLHRVQQTVSKGAVAGKNIVSFHPYLESAFHCFLNCNRRARNSGASANVRTKGREALKLLIFLNKFRFPRQNIVNVVQFYSGDFDTIPALYDTKGLAQRRQLALRTLPSRIMGWGSVAN